MVHCNAWCEVLGGDGSAPCCWMNHISGSSGDHIINLAGLILINHSRKSTYHLLITPGTNYQTGTILTENCLRNSWNNVEQGRVKGRGMGWNQLQKIYYLGRLLAQGLRVFHIKVGMFGLDEDNKY